MNNRVVITGMGAITPIGNSVNEFWNNIKNGVVGIDKITKFDTSLHKVTLAAEVKDFDPVKYMEKKEVRRMDLFCQYAIAAAKEAIEHSGITIAEDNADDIGCIIGSGIGGLSTIEQEEKKLLEKGPQKVSPFMIPMIIGNMAAGNVSMRFGLRGKSMSIVTACTTAANSIGEAYRSIKYGEVAVMVAGGCEASITPLGIAGFTSLTALNETDDPKRASIPFDLERSGFVMGEGAGVLVLEELEHAKKRGANILAEIVGYGATCDAYHITSPEPEGTGAARAMLLAMEEAGITPDQVDYINAHGTSTPINDLYETRAIKKAFKEDAYKVPINSTKSMIGHLLGAAGAVELITCVKSIEEGYVHQNVGLKVKDPECDLDYVANKGRKMEVNYALSNSLGFGGHNGSLLIKKY